MTPTAPSPTQAVSRRKRKIKKKKFQPHQTQHQHKHQQNQKPLNGRLKKDCYFTKYQHQHERHQQVATSCRLVFIKYPYRTMQQQTVVILTCALFACVGIAAAASSDLATYLPPTSPPPQPSPSTQLTVQKLPLASLNELPANVFSENTGGNSKRVGRHLNQRADDETQDVTNELESIFDDEKFAALNDSMTQAIVSKLPLRAGDDHVLQTRARGQVPKPKQQVAVDDSVADDDLLDARYYGPTAASAVEPSSDETTMLMGADGYTPLDTGQAPHDLGTNNNEQSMPSPSSAQQVKKRAKSGEEKNAKQRAKGAAMVGIQQQVAALAEMLAPQNVNQLNGNRYATQGRGDKTTQQQPLASSSVRFLHQRAPSTVADDQFFDAPLQQQPLSHQQLPPPPLIIDPNILRQLAHLPATNHQPQSQLQQTTRQPNLMMTGQPLGLVRGSAAVSKQQQPAATTIMTYLLPAAATIGGQSNVFGTATPAMPAVLPALLQQPSAGNSAFKPVNLFRQVTGGGVPAAQRSGRIVNNGASDQSADSDAKIQTKIARASSSSYTNSATASDPVWSDSYQTQQEDDHQPAPQTIQITAVPNGLGGVGNGLWNNGLNGWNNFNAWNNVGGPWNGRQVLLVNKQQQQTEWRQWVIPLAVLLALPLLLGGLFVPVFLKSVMFLIQILQMLGLLLPPGQLAGHIASHPPQSG